MLDTAELAALRAALMAGLPSALLDADVAVVDRPPNVTVFVDCSLRATRRELTEAMADRAFVAALELALGVRTVLLVPPQVVSIQTLRMPSPPPAPPPPTPPFPEIVEDSYDDMSAPAQLISSAAVAVVAAVAASVAAVLILGLLLACLAWRRRRRTSTRQPSAKKATRKADVTRKSLLADESESVTDDHLQRLGDGVTDATEKEVRSPATPNVAAAPSRPGLTAAPAQLFTARICANSLGEFRIQLVQDDDETDVIGGGEISISLVGDSDVVDDRATVSEGDLVRAVNGKPAAGLSLRAVQGMLTGSGAEVELTLQRTRGLPTNVMHVMVEAVEVVEVDTESDADSDDLPHSPAEAEAAASDARVVVGSPLSLLDQMLQAEAGHDQTAERPRPSVSNAQVNLDRTRNYAALMRI